MSRSLSRDGLWVLAVAVTVACAGCTEPAAVPPPDAPWLDAAQQIELLKLKDDRLRALAANNLGNLGAQAAEAIPELEKLSRDPNPKVSQNASQALEKIRAAMDTSSE